MILNTAGAALGFAFFWIAAALLNRSSRGRAFLDRTGAASEREPLLLARFPVGLTALITVPVMVATVVSGTLSDGPNGIVGDATAGWPDSSLVARADVAEHAFLVIREASSEADQLRLAVYKRVLPGRYTWIQTGEMPAGPGSRYSWTITSFNVTTDEQPLLVYWGSNQAGATVLMVTGAGLVQRLPLATSDFFVVGFAFDPNSLFAGDGVMAEPQLQFLDGGGHDVTSEFVQTD